jgi:hypothetical protein
MQVLKKLFSTPVASVFALLMSIVAINTWQLELPNFSYDNSFSIAAAKNIYDGKGYTLTTASPEDLSVTSYEPLNKWPPGYSWLLFLVKRITGTDWIIACYILNAIGATLLILALRKIFLLLQVPQWAINTYLLFAGFFPYPFLSDWFSDLMAVAFFMWAIVFLLQMIVTNRNIYACGIAAGALLGFCTWLKYLYLSVSLIPFVFLLFYSTGLNNLRLSKALASGGLVLSMCILYILWFQHDHTGNAFYINPTGKGFFPQNLLHLGAFIPGSLIDFKFFDMQLSTWLRFPYLKMMVVWKWVNAFLLVALTALAILHYRKNGLRLSTVLSVYLHLTWAISISILVLLVYLSLTQRHYSDNSTLFWTYVGELRYYAVALIFIQQGILFWMIYQKDLQSRLRVIFVTILVFILSVDVSHGVYYLSKKAIIKREIGKNRKSEQMDFLALETADSLAKRENKIVIYSDIYQLANIASLSGISVLYDYDNMNKTLHSSKPVTLLVILGSPALPAYERFLSLYKPTLFLKYNMPGSNNETANFYIVKLP